MRVTDVFTPGALPSHTYYNRPKLNLEQRLKDAIDTKGYIASVSGPSKCGKTVLCETVIGKQGMMLITGGGVTKEELFWDRIRNNLKIPTKIVSSSGKTTTSGFSGKAGAGLQIPLFLEGKGEFGADLKRARQEGITQEFAGNDPSGLLQILNERSITLVVDDFHYIDPKVQISLARQFKEASRSGNKIVIVSVSHRADQAIRANPQGYRI